MTHYTLEEIKALRAGVRVGPEDSHEKSPWIKWLNQSPAIVDQLVPLAEENERINDLLKTVDEDLELKMKQLAESRKENERLKEEKVFWLAKAEGFDWDRQENALKAQAAEDVIVDIISQAAHQDESSAKEFAKRHIEKRIAELREGEKK